MNSLKRSNQNNFRLLRGITCLLFDGLFLEREESAHGKESRGDESDGDEDGHGCKVVGFKWWVLNGGF